MTQKKISGYTVFLAKLLGKGTYGSVYKGVKDGTEEHVAVKIIQKKKIDSDEYMKSALLSEIQTLQTIKSQNVVALFDVMQSSHNYYIIQQLCDGDLQNLLRKQKIFDQDKAIGLLKQICKGFLSLVRQGIVHRDLKPANVMLSKGHVKIGDFGFAKKKHKNLKIQSAVGTPMYMSPQILKHQCYTSKCDIWALGTMIYQMIHGDTPWKARSQYQLVKNIYAEDYKLLSTLSDKTKDFINKCLQREQQKRISWDQLFVHPIFQGHFKSYSEQNQMFQNKLKGIMSELRFKINQQNIDLKKLFSRLGFEPSHDLSFKEFSTLLKSINPEIKSDQQVYFFEKMDNNGDGKLSLKQLQEQMQRNHINLTSLCQNKLVDIIFFGKTESTNQQSFDQVMKKVSMNSQLQLKVKRCFIKLFKIFTLKKLTLYRTFIAYDSDKSGQLGMQQFQRVMKRLDGSFTQQEIQSVFEFIDKDNSKTIKFDELNSYYCKVNQIPEALDLPADYSH